MNTLADYQVGDVLELTKRFIGKDKTYIVEVTVVDFNGNGLVTCSGLEAGQGAFDPTLVGKLTRFQHIVNVKKIGHSDRHFYAPWSGLTHKDAMRYYGVG